MIFKVRDEGGYAILELTGDIDLAVAPDARRSVLDCLEAGRNLLVDLSQTSYIDSSGVACLVEGYQTARKQNLQFGLIGVSEAAMGVLELARLDKVFPIHADVEARLNDDG